MLPAMLVSSSPVTRAFQREALTVLQARAGAHVHEGRPANPASDPARAVTAPARRRRCRCMTYAEVRPWARSIEHKVTNREMPPWHIDRSIGEYAIDPSLSDAEVATIAAWVDRGAPQGNVADAPPPVRFHASTEWTYGEPDLVVRMAKGFKIPASGPTSFPRSSWIPA